MTPILRLAVALGLAALLGGAASLSAATVRTVSLADMVSRADRIVVAEVVEVRCVARDMRGDTIPITLVTLSVRRALKGAGANQLILEFPGGRLDADRLEIDGLPRFAAGDRDILFLHADTLQVSPLVGLMQGRVRILAAGDPPRDYVAAWDGRLLTEADPFVTGVGQASRLSTSPLSASRLPPAGSGQVTLAAFEQAVRQKLQSGDLRSAADAQASQGAESGGVEAWFLPSIAATAPQPTRVMVDVHLGPSPALLDGCPDWACALASREAFRRLARIDTASADPSGAAETISMEWGRSLFGYAMDEDTAALTVRRTTGSAASTRVVFNDRLGWNSRGEDATSLTSNAATPASASSRRLVDLPAVAVRELLLLTTGQAAQAAAGSAASSSAAAERGATPTRVLPARSESVAEPRDAAASACNAAQAFVDPTSLMFESPDSVLMTGYQVGFFRPDAGAPTRIVDLPLNALMIHRVVDLPPDAVRGLQASLVANIRTSGLATPLGIIYTYRVRGVYSGGTTAWSGSSQAFVRCSD